MAHIHAELMKQYAEDAAETDKPWERWEFNPDAKDVGWIALSAHPSWNEESSYRRIPNTLTVTVKVPRPLKEWQAGCYVVGGAIYPDVHPGATTLRWASYEEARQAFDAIFGRTGAINAN